MTKKYFKVALAILLAAFVCSPTFAQYVQTKKDTNGWRLLVDNRPFEVKGVVWGYTPIGADYNYDLFSKSDDYVMKMIDTDMPMLKAMGVNTIRCFSTIPPKWIEYIYTKYGIYTMVNDLLGRYGISVNGKWHSQTDYSDLYTREVLVAQAKKTAETYRATKGVLMYMFGNESNYGLVWSGSNIENLPTGEQDSVRAGYLYSLLEEAMAACKDIDPLRPVGFINGDVQNLDLIKALCPSLDILGVNAYRGYKFYDSFYQNIAETLDKPVVLTEAGADAYNALLRQEDQNMQASYLASQWEEMYGQAYGKGRSGNILGGYVFEWIDEWWKKFQNKNLAIHDTEGSWANAGYDIDYRVGVNNMDEEWFGLVAQSELTDNGINKRIPRAAYYMLADIWKLSLYDSTQQDIDSAFASLRTATYLARGNDVSVKEAIAEQKRLKVSAFDVTVGSLTPLDHTAIAEAVKAKTALNNTLEVKPYAEANIGIEANPVENLTANVNLKVWTNPKQTKMADISDMYDYVSSTGTCSNHAMLYSGSFNYATPNFDVNGYYHVGHGAWETTGDIFNINHEAYDIEGYDYNDSQAPIALEFVGKGLLSGLQIIGGPEIYGYTEPQVAINYFRSFPSSSVWMPSFDLGLVYVEEFGSPETPAANAYNTYGAGRKASIYAKATLPPFVTLKVGGLYAGSEKVGAKYYFTSSRIKAITALDTLGGSVELGTDIIRHSYIYAKYIYRGLVADTNAEVIRGNFFTGDSGSGNRQEGQFGAEVNYGALNIRPVVRARMPLVDATGSRALTATVAGYADNYSPFIVYWNRTAVEIETVVTYDLEGGTWFHEWNSNDIEGSRFAASVAGMYTPYAGKTDCNAFKMKDDTWTSFKSGLPEQYNLWLAGGRFVANPLPDFRAIGTFEIGHQGSSGMDSTVIDYWGAGAQLRYQNFMLKGNYTANKWGPASWYRQFNLKYPAQWSVDLSYAFSSPSFLLSKNRVGIQWNGWTYGSEDGDVYSAIASAAKSGNSYSELTIYFNVSM